ncbi:hypothetical protein GCM10010271_00030 [Streptomyces kurssanovii]|nr:hypothetical protein GCM10010271_00030 [Streptomyces kurssanovii]
MREDKDSTQPEGEDEQGRQKPGDEERQGVQLPDGIDLDWRPQYETTAALIGTAFASQATAMQKIWENSAGYRSVLASLESLIQPVVDWPRLQKLAGTLEHIHRVAAVAAPLMPENWQKEKLSYRAMVSVIEEGIPLAWVPPASVIRELLEATDAKARFEVLESNQAVVIEQCGAALEAVTDPGLEHQAGLLQTCVEMAGDGYLPGAQALASNVLDTLFRGIWRAEPNLQQPNGKWDTYAKVAARLPEIDADASTILEFRMACALAPFRSALDGFKDGPVPSVFNRHATAHAAGRTQYTAVNALVALMLTVSLLRELQEGHLGVQIHA